jgi:hypothetical protein
MKNNVPRPVNDVKQLNKMKILIRMMDEICRLGSAKQETLAEWKQTKEEEQNNA